MMAKYSISITELTREANQQNSRISLLMGDFDEDPANEKVISIMYLALFEAARKQIMDEYPNSALWRLVAQQLIILCTDCFRKTRNRTLDRHQFFSRLQQPLGKRYPNFGMQLFRRDNKYVSTRHVYSTHE